MKSAKTRIVSLLLLLVMVMGMLLTSCMKPDDPDNGKPGGGENNNGGGNTEDKVFDLVYADGTTLRMAVGYNNAKTGLFFDASVAGDGITLADGKTYHTGDLKPTWVAVKDQLKINFENKYQGNSASKEWDYWKEILDQVDFVSGTASQLSEAGVAGKLINIADYLDHMPNFKKYLEDNDIVRLSITGDVSDGAIYFSPYFDGVDDIERMPLMRTDWVVKLLDGDTAFVNADAKNLAASAYTPYMPTSGKVTVDTVKADGTGTFALTKDYDKAGNIIKTMNDALAAGTVNGAQAVAMLREYIDEAYNGYYGTNRSNLFIGQDAAWDADELVALLRCVVANAKVLNGTDTVQGLFSREDDNNQRRVDMFRFAGTLFGVRGLESRQDYLYVGADGKLHDARADKATYEALERMNALVTEGLISTSFVNAEDTDTKTMLKNDAGFMHYDYNQTQTVYNQTELQDGEKYMVVMVPVARWYDGSNANGVYMRFTESWRSVKTDGWAISKAGVEGNTDKLHACLAIIDFAYSEKGQILMSYGPDAFIKTKADGSYETFNFNGKDMPVIADATYAELWEKASGNYTNYARQYLGSTLSFLKSQAFEYQCTHIVGKEGIKNISTAIGLGTIKHPVLAIAENKWYTSVPTTLPTTAEENTIIAGYKSLASKGGLYSSSKGEVNILVDMIAGGYAAAAERNNASTITNADNAVAAFKTTFNGDAYLAFKEGAWQRLLTYYASLEK